MQERGLICGLNYMRRWCLMNQIMAVPPPPSGVMQDCPCHWPIKLRTWDSYMSGERPPDNNSTRSKSERYTSCWQMHAGLEMNIWSDLCSPVHKGIECKAISWSLAGTLTPQTCATWQQNYNILCYVHASDILAPQFVPGTLQENC